MSRHRVLGESPDALGYLARRKIDHPEAIGEFRLGYADRTLGLRLPDKRRKEGAELRGRLERLGVFRASSHLFPQVSARPNRLRVRYARLVRVLPQKTPAGWRVAWMSFIVRSIRLPRTVALRP